MLKTLKGLSCENEGLFLFVYMNYEMTNPCGGRPNCPFRTDCMLGWLGRERAEEIVDSLVRSEFPCHKTTEYFESEEGGDLRETRNSQHCAGALIMLEHMEQPSQMMRICERLGLYDRRKLDMDAPVFTDAESFIDHHTDE